MAYAWDLDDDGIFGEASTERGDETLQNPMYSAVGLDGPSSQPMALGTRSNLGQWSEVASTTVSLTNVAPTATLNAPTEVDEGSEITVSLTDPFDPSSVDTASGFEYAFDFGSEIRCLDLQ